jgi:general secretion pathway protein G
VPSRRRSLAASLVLATCLGACQGSGRRDEAPRPPERAAIPSTAAGADLGRIDTAVRRFARDHGGRLPSSLDALTSEVAAEGGAYLRRVPLDPWGRPFSYAVTAPRLGAYDLRSYGPDTLPGTDDDVVSQSGPVPLD